MENDPREWNNLASNPDYAKIKFELKQRVIEFWQPEKQIERYLSPPMMKRKKHFYYYSNQFVLSDGTIVGGRP